jgi:hypothetical protein
VVVGAAVVVVVVQAVLGHSGQMLRYQYLAFSSQVPRPYVAP